MKKALVALIAGTILSGMAAGYAATFHDANATQAPAAQLDAEHLAALN